MFNSREEIAEKLKEYKDLIESNNIDYNTITEILNFLSKFGYLAELRDALILYINNFLKDKPELSVIEYQKSLSIFPEDDEIFEKFINFLNSTNISPKEKNVYIKTYIKVLSTIGKFGKAINIINEIINANPDDIDNLILAANVYETEGHIDKAVNLYLQAVQKIQNLDEKIKIREQISVIDPGNKENILELVKLYNQKKEFEASSKILRNLLRFNQNDPEILYKIAEVDNLKANYRGATIAIKRAIEIDPLNPKYRYLLGIIYFNSGTKTEAEKILDQTITELYQNNLNEELKEAIKILTIIKDSYKEKYADIIKTIEEQEIKIEQEKNINTTELKQKIIEEQLTIQEEKIESKIEEKIKVTEQKDETKQQNYERETLPKVTKRSTGVFIKKESPEQMAKKTILTKKENLLIKESAAGIQKTQFLKKDVFQTKSLEKPSLEKPSLEKPSLEKSSLEKPSLEKPSLEKSSLEKPSLEKSSPEKSSLDKTPMEELYQEETSPQQPTKIQDITQKTVIISKEELLQDLQKEKNEIVLEVEKDKNINQENIKNIEIEMYENTLLEILSNFSSFEVVLTNSIKLLDNITQLTNNKFKLLIWIYRILTIANVYGLNKIRQKIEQIMKTLGYEKALQNIYYQSKENSINSIMEEIFTCEEFSKVNESIKEIVRYIIQENFINNFIKIYQIMKNKFPDKINEINNTFIDVINEEKNTDFMYIFLKISKIQEIEKFSIDNIEQLLNYPEYGEIIENYSISQKCKILINSIINQKLNLVNKIIKKTSDVNSLIFELYNSFPNKISINIENIEDYNSKIILYPLIKKETIEENHFLEETIENPKINKNLWLLSYLFSSQYPIFIFLKINLLKDSIISLIENLRKIDDTFKKTIIEITYKIITNDQKINEYIDEILEKFTEPNQQFMILLIQAWYNQNINIELTNKIIQKLEIIVDEMKEKELLEFYKNLKENRNGRILEN